MFQGQGHSIPMPDFSREMLESMCEEIMFAKATADLPEINPEENSATLAAEMSNYLPSKDQSMSLHDFVEGIFENTKSKIFK